MFFKVAITISRVGGNLTYAVHGKREMGSRWEKRGGEETGRKERDGGKKEKKKKKEPRARESHLARFLLYLS